MKFPAPQPVPLATALRWSQSPEWIYEEKHDGVRAMLANGALQGRARNYALPGELPADLIQCVFDGELVGSRFHVFDVCEADGQDLRAWPLAQRKRRLAAFQTQFPPWIQAVPVWTGCGAEYLEAIIRDGGEGVVAKHIAAPYGQSWFKAKRLETFDVVILETAGHRLSVGIGEWRGGALHDAGRVAIHSLAVLERLRAFDVVEIAAHGRTARGKFRGPRFLRVRTDKPPTECEA